MRSAKLGWVLVLLLLGACASLPSSDFDEPTIDLVGLRPMATEGLEARFEMSLRVVNPNDFALELKGVYYELDVEGNRLLSGASSEHVTVPAFGEALLKLEAGTSMFGSFNLIRELMGRPPEDGIAYELNAKISIANRFNSIRVSRAGKLGENAVGE